MRHYTLILGLSISLAGMTSMLGCGDSAVTDGGPRDLGTVTDGPAVDMPGTGSDCATYCGEVMAHCTMDNAVYNDTADCMSYCAAAMWPAGVAGAMSGNTLACRIYHGGGPAMMDPVTHCPHAGPTGAGVCGTTNFRTDIPSTYTRVDRMGMPAVSTALVPSATKNAYNDANPSDDAAGTFVPNLATTLTALHTALDADLVTAHLTPCSMTTLIGTLPECFGQNVAAGTSVASLVVPDTLQINPAMPAGFPNGRTLTDPVINVTLAIIFLKLGSPCGTGTATCSALTLVGPPAITGLTNPGANDVAFDTAFPYLAAPHGP